MIFQWFANLKSVQKEFPNPYIISSLLNAYFSRSLISTNLIAKTQISNNLYYCRINNVGCIAESDSNHYLTKHLFVLM